ncbi:MULTISPECIES: DsbE family thiol:disulfide interchange protein [Shewanella]|jgi:cytochrome c biogenesis protein CcmG/thiol:disulfide interchange protein DsbE|uniref:Periplasmic protein thiol/disulfide oxidoreductase DsbE n=3 Tax=Shewanella putrefaciens TaxID=24 RepID=E6XQZ3_SHEP2|nr:MULTISPECIES: DsbE family thiol:disulfide interchange protein [Shewanella]CAD6364739.1 Thiol:disulfide interchange protein DsbE [Shewanella hafniensis]ABM23044.1 periplasmic protein thiol--disulphide oxidoreductase DsbE [Shewanella sp. W3-18-1]AVV84302.1 thiol:disulfide interchange protein [Shewanella putrefaciens]MCA1898964.1 DsbE family thiol:disulfide interchange protein [Shewanella putrefaciens]MCK7631165.1 DsbE family thiol:disulfide interchange protein [Shewanella sp. JNE9-1]
MKKLVLFIPLVLFLAMGVFLYKGLFLNPQKLDSALEGKPIPAFQLERLETPDELITNEQLKGKVALLNVWATWCPSCKYEHPFLNMLSRKNILPIYGINYRDERAPAIAELRRQGDPYTLNIFDKDGRLGLDLGVYGAPESFIVDHNGIIRFRYAGPIDQNVWSETLFPMIQQLQAEAAKDNVS